MTTTLVALAAIIVVALAAYAGTLLWQVKQKRAQQQNAVDRLIHQKKESETYARDSIIILLQGLQQEQVSLTEVAIRITGLCQVLPSTERNQYVLFEELANAASHIPIKDAWKALSRKQQKAFDKERAALETKYQARIDSVVAQVLGSTKTSAPTMPLFAPADKTVH